MSIDITVLCRRPLPKLAGGWDSDEWTEEKYEAGVALFEYSADRFAELAGECGELAAGPFVAAVGLNCRSAAGEHAEAYADAIARACAGVVLYEGEEVLADYDSVELQSGEQIEAEWRNFDRQWNEEAEAEAEEELQAWIEEKRRDPEGTREANSWADVMPD